ncbi:hypothetical protein HanRHA438_Chr11g0506261 [Helianthus annuus]|nr:hypothetical protein HanRHA438_Chr11g0506261 [Helianthus annuus]
MYAFTFKDLIDVGKNISGTQVKKKAFYGMVIIACWRIWKALNENLFSNKNTKMIDIVLDVKVLGCLWFRNRCKGYEVDWEKWCKFELM